ncbi:ABC transporter substrate-binding protein [Leptospira perolatii]|uniref:ABC transporter substrate-binding protein n=1 Tax=Leptospira perolatii TaxID=2023191 RepID=A0A2M9ZKG5_9LEPT|nr:nitrous oxide reductase family maturation protein NosD [Leptospira perolatii]PJZ68139.1 ABC transporter substrate-binding protein [Leptospira perolatii]PJZ72557.1 ABC transporter substrate-binding protein [Leptospira perolatii]
MNTRRRFTGKYFRSLVRILLSLCLLPLISFSLSSREIQVCRDCKINSVKAAVATAQNGDSILIQSGIYKEGSIPIERRISIQGSSDTLVDGQKIGHVFDVKSDGVRIRGVKIVGSGISDTTEYAGIHAENVKDCKFEGNSFEDTAYAIYLANVDGCLVSQNETTGNAKNEVSGGNGVHLWSSKNVQILENKIQKHRDGIYLEFSSNLKIEDNTSKDNIRYGMHFMFSSDNDFRRNEFSGNSAGVAVMYSKNILVESNIFRNNWGDSSYGLLLKEISESIFTKNQLVENTVAIFSDGCNRNYFTHNKIENNGWGIRLLGNSDSNIFAKNDFANNVFDISTNAKRTSNQFLENFWDRYSGYDLNRDAFGDIPFRPVHFFGYWVTEYPFLMILYESPVVLFLQGLEKAFPIVIPVDFEDKKPSMKENI